MIKGRRSGVNLMDERDTWTTSIFLLWSYAIWMDESAKVKKYQIYKNGEYVYFDKLEDCFREFLCVYKIEASKPENISKIMKFAALIRDEDS